MLQAVGRASLALFTDGFGTDAVALGGRAVGLDGLGDLDPHGRGGSAFGWMWSMTYLRPDAAFCSRSKRCAYSVMASLTGSQQCFPSRQLGHIRYLIALLADIHDA